MRLTYSSTAPGRFAGVEIAEDGTASAWQTAGHRVGRFRRPLTTAESTGLMEAVRAARDAGPPPPASGPRRPGGVVERISADDLPDLTVTDDPPAAVAALAEQVRALLEDLARSPVAAIELTVTGRPSGVRLGHVGDDPMTLRSAGLTVEAAVFDGDGGLADTASRTVPSGLDGGETGSEVGPGWALPLTDDLGVPEVPDGGYLTVTVGGAELDVRGDGVLRPVEWGWMSE